MGSVLTTADQMMCPHGGSVSMVSTNVGARAGGAFILRTADVFTVVGCSFNVSGAPHPCVSVTWQMPSRRLSATGEKALTTDSIGMCKAADQAVQGTVKVAKIQQRVSAE